MNKSALITPALIHEVMALATPTIEGIIKLDSSRSVISIVILDPVAAAAGEFRILWKGAVGEQDRTKWARQYDQFAEAKASVTFQTKLPSHLVQRDFAHLYVDGNFKYGGSEYRKGIIVAASGLAWHHDYAVSALVASLIDGFVKGAFEVEYGRKPFFIGALDPTE